MKTRTAHTTPSPTTTANPPAKRRADRDTPRLAAIPFLNDLLNGLTPEALAACFTCLRIVEVNPSLGAELRNSLKDRLQSFVDGDSHPFEIADANCWLAFEDGLNAATTANVA